jgi:hypothetical protein
MLLIAHALYWRTFLIQMIRNLFEHLVESFNYFNCLRIVTSSRFGNIAIVIVHFLELTFKFTSIVKDNKLRTGITRQPVVMKRVLEWYGRFRYCLWQSQTILWLYLLKWGLEESLSWVVSTQTMTQGSDSAILGGSKPYFLRSGFVNWQIRQAEIIVQHPPWDLDISWCSW